MQYFRIFSIFLTLFLATACAPDDAEQHSHHESHEHDTEQQHSHQDTDKHHQRNEEKETHTHASEKISNAASFKKDKGIQISAEAQKALGISTAVVTRSSFIPSVTVTAQVYRTATETTAGNWEKMGAAYASVFVDDDLIHKMKIGQRVSIAFQVEGNMISTSGQLSKIDKSFLSATSRAEVIIEIPDLEGKLKLGSFVTAILPEDEKSKDIVAVPVHAVLDTAAGKFSYVENGGGYLLRKPITSGAVTDDLIEITEGLSEGDSIAVTGVEALYLIELRSTKGGGHSH